MIRLENQSPAAFQVNRELARPVPTQGVRPPGYKISDTAGGLIISQPGTQFSGTGRAELAFRHVPPLTHHGSFVLEVDFTGVTGMS